MRDHLLTQRAAAAANPENLEVLDMSIDEAGMSVLMGNLTNLYAKPELAVLREYVANALDSHALAGQRKPIIVKLPVPDYFDSGELVIEDFGTGMSKAEIRDVYSRYGASTKRESNGQIGKFGLGAKSALAIAERFDIVATKDGMQTHAYVQKTAAGTGQFFFSSESQVDAPNGVRVTIPISSASAYGLDALRWFFVGIDPQRIDISGGVHVPSNSVHNPEEFDSLIFSGSPVGWVARKESSDDINRTYLHVNVGGIHYELNASKLEATLERLNPEAGENFALLRRYQRVVVLNAPLGGVRLTPSREDFIYDELTLDTLATLINYVVSSLYRRAQSSLNAQASLKEAYLFYSEQVTTSLPNVFELRYRGEPVPLKFAANGWARIHKLSTSRIKEKDRIDRYTDSSTLMLSELGLPSVSQPYSAGSTLRFFKQVPLAERKAILITEASEQDVLLAQRQLLKSYEELRFASGRDANVWFLAPGVNLSPWVEPLITERLTFDEFKKQARAQQQARRTEAKAAGLTSPTKDPVKFALFKRELAKSFANSTAQPYEIELLTPAEIMQLGKPVVISHRGLSTHFNLGMFSGGSKSPKQLNDYHHAVRFMRHYRPDALLVGVPKGVKIESLAERFPNHELLSEVLMAEVQRALSNTASSSTSVAAAAKLARSQSVYRLAVVCAFAKKLTVHHFAQLRSDATRKWLSDLIAGEQEVPLSSLSMDEQLLRVLGKSDERARAQAQETLKKWRARADQYVLLPTSISSSVVRDEALDHFVQYLNMVDKSGEQ